MASTGPRRPLDLAQASWACAEPSGQSWATSTNLRRSRRAAEEVRYREGTRLWSVGDHAGYMLVLLSGVVQGGTPHGAVFHMGPRDVLGSLDAISGQARWFGAVATQELIALKLESEVLVDIWEDHPALACAFLRFIAASQLALSERE